MRVLGIESSCDETGVALVEDGFHILSSEVATQEDIHAAYGGVFPELASRRHVDVMLPVMQRALQKAGLGFGDVDLVAVTCGPGLIGALLVGLNCAKALSLALKKPFIGIDHVEGHLFAAIMSKGRMPKFPCLGVILSGGHTHMIRMDGIGKYTLVAKTVDDAVGEAFDKVARILDLPYPGGPHIEALAQQGDQKSFPFRGGRVRGRPLDFSFSGLKTAVLYAVRDLESVHKQDKQNIAASFQRAAFEDIVKKTHMAAKEMGAKDILLGGGVTANLALRGLFEERLSDVSLWWPDGFLSLDNAAMIAGLGYVQYTRLGHGDHLSLEAQSLLNF